MGDDAISPLKANISLWFCDPVELRLILTAFGTYPLAPDLFIIRTGDVSVTRPTPTSSFSGRDMGSASGKRAMTEGVGGGVARKISDAGYKIKAVSFW